MASEIILVKRVAKAGEIGLFCDSQVFEEEWSSLPRDKEIKAVCTAPAILRHLKWFWCLCGKVVENSPAEFLDKQDAADRILVQSRHCKMIHDPLRNTSEIKPKSISGLSEDTWMRLRRRVMHVVLTQYLPGVEESALTAEIEKMVGIDAARPQDKKSTPKGGEHGKPSGDARDPTLPTADRAGPQTEAEYITACRAWLPKQDDRFKALNHFEGDSHKEMRHRLKISQGVFKMLQREIQTFFNEKEAKT